MTMLSNIKGNVCWVLQQWNLAYLVSLISQMEVKNFIRPIDGQEYQTQIKNELERAIL